MTSQAFARRVPGPRKWTSFLLLGVLTLGLALLQPHGAGARPSAPLPDPTEAGPFPVRAVDYDALVTVVQSSIGGFANPAYPERLRGRLHFPDTGSGPFPAVVFLHGRHETCRIAGSIEALVWPCPDAGPVIEDLPSWVGFDYVASNLASHGYVAMSINANGINFLGTLDGTPERVQLLERSLDLLAEWNDGARSVPDGVGDALTGRVDLARVGLLGHSRGGQAVEVFMEAEADRSERRYPGVQAVLSLAPSVNFSQHTPYGLPFATVLASCDGDVGVAGAFTWDKGRFADPGTSHSRVQFYVVGANHNWFNSEWPDEWTMDFDDACFPERSTNIRLARQDQERIGTALINGFLRRHVGGEMAFDPLMTGESTLPASACPTAGVGPGQPVSCDEIVKTSYLAPASARRILLLPGPDANATEDGGAVHAQGFTEFSVCGQSSGECPEQLAIVSAARQLTLVWDGPATLRVEPGSQGGDASGFRSLTFRTAINPNDQRNAGVPRQDLLVTLIDEHGTESSVAASRFSSALAHPPRNATSGSTAYERGVLNGVRIPLAEFDVDVHRLAAVELRFGSLTTAGSIQVSELALQETP